MLSLPVDVRTQIIPWLNYDVWTLCSFGLTSKAAGGFFRQIAQSKDDINLAGKTVTFLCKDKTTLKACIIQILKIEALDTYPELRSNIAKARDAVIAERKNPNDISCLRAYGVPHSPGQLFWMSAEDHRLLQALVPFDFQTQKINNPSGLSPALSYAISENKIILAQIIFAHPTSKKFTGENLGNALIAAASMNNGELVYLIRSHHNANNCPDNCFRPALAYAVKNNNLNLTKLILSFQYVPNNSIDHPLHPALLAAIRIKNPKLIRKVLSHPDAKNIPLQREEEVCGGLLPPQKVGLLERAVETNDPQVIAAVLLHPRIIKLPEEELYAAGNELIANEDMETLLQVRRMLEEEKPNQLKVKDLGKAFICLSFELQYFFYVMLCKTHGCRSGNIKKDGMVHLIKHPHSLLTIIARVTACKQE